MAINTDSIIKVHVNRAQREEMELLVNRRIGDIKMESQQRQHRYANEMKLLEELKVELRQAGS